MNLNELCNTVAYNPPVITAIMNNNVLGNVRQWQTMFYEKRYSPDQPVPQDGLHQVGGSVWWPRFTPPPTSAELRAALGDALQRTVRC